MWSFDNEIQSSTNRLWIFTPRYGLGLPENLASISGAGAVFIHSSLIQFAVEKPATLVLKNVDSSYDGEYLFGLTSAESYSYVTVSITGKFYVNFSHSNQSARMWQVFKLLAKNRLAKKNVTLDKYKTFFPY